MPPTASFAVFREGSAASRASVSQDSPAGKSGINASCLAETVAASARDLGIFLCPHFSGGMLNPLLNVIKGQVLSGEMNLDQEH